MRVRDTDYLYATMRIRSMERFLITPEIIHRMLDAKTAEDAAKILSEIGFPEINQVSLFSIESSISKLRSETFKILHSITSNHSLIDFFAIKYDYHNMKAFIKASHQEQAADSIFIDSGRISVQTLKNMLTQDDFIAMSKIMTKAITEAKEVLSRTGDPQLFDFVLDRAMYAEMKQEALSSGDDFLTGYFRLLIDIQNLRSTVRAGRLKKDSAFLLNALIPDGNISTHSFLTAFEGSQTLKDLFSGSPLEAAAEAGSSAMTGVSSFTNFEKLCDKVLLKYLTNARFVPFGPGVIVSYIGAFEQQLITARTIMAGKMEGLPSHQIAERLREL